jgi:hypothetical protein
MSTKGTMDTAAADMTMTTAIANTTTTTATADTTTTTMAAILGSSSSDDRKSYAEVDSTRIESRE